MKVPLSWLKEYVDLPFSSEQIAESLTLAGLEVDKVESSALSFEGVVIAKVLEAIPHPNADRLKVAKVFDGKEEHQVVCGAPNCRAGLVTAFAKLGASLKDPDGKTWKIKKSKIRDVESYGMLCAADELGLPLKGEGILELPDSLPLGSDLSLLYSDTIFDLSLTPNLGHCMSIYGVARELSALLKTPLKKLHSSFQEGHSPSTFSVQVEDKKQCSHYSCRLIKSVQVGPSPDWLVQKLNLVDVRSINNVVDISNYVMMATGQPLHFFDADKIHGHKLYVSASSTEATVTTLDEISREIPADSLVIRDEKEILAIAGIMGSLDSAVSEKTHNILVEAAVFQPTSIRKTSKALSLKTDSSHRFEKGIDPLMIPYALDLATELLVQIASGSAPEKKVDIAIHPFNSKKVLCRRERVNRLLGIHLSLSEIAEMLERLQIKVVKEHADALEVLIPSHRNDINEEIDLVEEVARLYGFNHLSKKAPLHYTSFLSDSPVFSFENKVRTLLLQEGLQEFMTCDLTSPFLSELVREKITSQVETLTVLQSKSSDFSVLRHSLLPGLLGLSKYNFDRGSQNLAGFEVGRVHFKQNGLYQEPVSISILLSGANTPHHHDPRPRPFDFFDVKGIVQNLLESLKIDGISFEASHLQSFQPGRQAYVQRNGESLGVLGEIHPSILSKIDLPQRVYCAELNLNELLKLQKPLQPLVDLPLYPSSERDWTLSLKKEIPIGLVLSCIQALAPSLLEKVFLLDLFESDQIGSDRKNVTWRFVYRDPQKTLDLPRVEQIHTKLLQMVAEKLHDCIL